MDIIFTICLDEYMDLNHHKDRKIYNNDFFLTSNICCGLHGGPIGSPGPLGAPGPLNELYPVGQLPIDRTVKNGSGMLWCMFLCTI